MTEETTLMTARRICFNIIAALFIAIFIVLLTVRIAHKIYLLNHPAPTQPIDAKEDE